MSLAPEAGGGGQVAGALTISGAAPIALVGDPATFAPAISGGVPPYRLTLKSGGLPAGASLADTGLTGAHTVAGAYGYVLRVTDLRGRVADLAVTTRVFTAQLGPAAASINIAAAAGSLVVGPTGLDVGEDIVSVSPNDGRLAISSNKQMLLVGLSAMSGTASFTYTTNLGRSATVAVTAAGATTTASMSIRTAQGGAATSSLTATGSICQRVRDMPACQWSNPSFEYWQGLVTATGNTRETGVGNGIYLQTAMLTNITDKSANQTGSTATRATFNAAAACVAGYIWKLDATTPSPADFAAACSAAGKTPLSTDGFTIYVPDGWRVRADKVMGLSGAASTPIYWQIRLTGSTGDQFPVAADRVSRNDLADATRTSTTQDPMTLMDWTSGSTLGSGTSQIALAGLWCDAPAGTITVGLVGDSIVDAQLDALDGATIKNGDGDGATGFAARGLNAAKRPFVRITRFGDTAAGIFTGLDAGGQVYAQRGLALRFCSRAFSDMGHNGRTASTWIATHQRWWALLKSYMLPGSKVVQTTLMPLTTSTDNWLTIANQTDTAGSQYTIVHPYLLGTLNPANGDPDKVYDFNAALYAYAVTAGWTLPPTPYRLWPVNGQATTTNASVNFDSTHPRGPAHAGIGADLSTKLPALLA